VSDLSSRARDLVPALADALDQAITEIERLRRVIADVDAHERAAASGLAEARAAATAFPPFNADLTEEDT